MCDETLRVRTSTIEIALLTKFLHQELSDLYPDEPESVLVISHVVLAKVIGEGGLEPSYLAEIPGLEGIDLDSSKIEALVDRLKQDGWVRQKSKNRE